MTMELNFMMFKDEINDMNFVNFFFCVMNAELKL